jgi:hypothetical protein
MRQLVCCRYFRDTLCPHLKDKFSSKIPATQSTSTQYQYPKIKSALTNTAIYEGVLISP